MRKLILPIGLFILNIILKIIFIDSTPIGGDEPFTIFYAQTDYDTLLAMFETENNPPLFTLIMKYWIQLVGISPFSVRILPLLFSSLTAVGIYHLGRKYASFYVGLIASLIFTFASYHIYFAHEARPYALFALLTVLSMIVYMQLTIDERKKRLYLLAIINAFLIYNHFFGFFVLLIQFLSFISIKSIRKESWKPLFISWGITFLIYLPYLPLVLKRFSVASGGTWVEPPGISGLYDNLWKFSNEPVNTVLFLSLLIAGLIIYFIRSKEVPKPYWKILIVWFLIPYLLMFALSFKIPMFLDRYLVYISIAYYLLIASAVDKIFIQTQIKWIIGIGLVLLMAATSDFNAGNTRGDGKFVQSAIHSKTDKTAIILSPDWYFMTFAYHYDRSIFKDYKNTVKLLERDNIFPRAYLAEDNSAEIMAMDRIVLVNTGIAYVDPENKMMELILQDFDLEEENTEFSPFILSTFRRRN